ncbi:hypothetical protein Roomu2_00085 [Pseudomonas phage vB_PpuM-Roomu-2]|uniref:Lipoprotein n=1 Tax=Pseudomonas phage vB_PpuM-Roomu-2 TaxID=3132621 RepID=A0AAX4MZ68_9CAUD
MNFLKNFIFGFSMFLLGAFTVLCSIAPKPIVIDTGSGYVRVKEIQSQELQVRINSTVNGKHIDVGQDTLSEMQFEFDRAFEPFNGVDIGNEITFRFYPIYLYRVVMTDGSIGIVKSVKPVVTLSCPVGMRGENCAMNARNMLNTLETK